MLSILEQFTIEITTKPKQKNDNSKKSFQDYLTFKDYITEMKCNNSAIIFL